MRVVCIIPEIDQQNAHEPKSSKTGNRLLRRVAVPSFAVPKRMAREPLPENPVSVTGKHKRRVPVIICINGDERVGFICFLDLSKLVVLMGAPRWRLTLSRLHSFTFHMKDAESCNGTEVGPLPPKLCREGGTVFVFRPCYAWVSPILQGGNLQPVLPYETPTVEKAHSKRIGGIAREPLSAASAFRLRLALLPIGLSCYSCFPSHAFLRKVWHNECCRFHHGHTRDRALIISTRAA